MVLIDDINIKDKYGVDISKEGYSELFSWCSLKKPYVNNWHEENGIDVDLTKPVLESREFDISFFGTNEEKTKAFVKFLIDKQVRLFKFPLMGGLQMPLRLVSMSNTGRIQSLSEFSIKFADDYPLHAYENLDAATLPDTSNLQSKIKINDKDLLGYHGASLMQGFVDEIEKLPKVKQGLTAASKFMHGSQYFDNGKPFKLEKSEINLKCLIKKPINTWAHYYYRLLFELTQPNERILQEAFFGRSYNCYYESSSVQNFSIINNSTVWLEFTIKLLLTNYLI